MSVSDPLRTSDLGLRITIMHRLTDEERKIRRSRGIGPRRWWPFAVLFLANFLASMDLSLFERCTGKVLDGGGRGGALVRAVLAYPCSPFLLRGSSLEWLLFAAMWVPVPFLLINRRWLKRHEGYWERIRQRERERREQRRSRKRL